MTIIIEMILEEMIFRDVQGYRGQNSIGRYRKNYRNDHFARGRNRSRERKYSENSNRGDRNSSRARSGLRAGTNRDRTICFKHREYDHFAK